MIRIAAAFLCALALGAAPAAAQSQEPPKDQAKGATKDEAKGEAKDKKDDKPAAPAPVVIAVIGDSLADGLWASIYRANVRQKHVKVLRLATNSAGFTAYEFERDFDKALAANPKIDVLVLQVGANDRQRGIDPQTGKSLLFKSEAWHQAYKARIANFLSHVQGKKIPVYWVGLPIARKPAFNEDSRMLVSIYKEMAGQHGAHFVDIWAHTANKDGEYDAFLADAEGRKKRYRADDGIHFTELGYDHVAAYVMTLIKAKMPELKVETTARTSLK